MDKTQEAAHTPGPWNLHLVDETVVTIPRCTPQHLSVLGDSEIADDEDYANARLIAQSPAFLAWAQRQLERKHRGQLFLDNEDVLELEQIVAKAAGSDA